MSLGGICVAFSAVVFVLTLAVSRIDSSQGLSGRIEVGLGSLVLGVILLGMGVLLGRFGRRSGDSIRER